MPRLFSVPLGTCISVQDDLGKSETWSDGNKTKFNQVQSTAVGKETSPVQLLKGG